MYIYHIDRHLACTWKESQTTFSRKSSAHHITSSIIASTFHTLQCRSVQRFRLVEDVSRRWKKKLGAGYLFHFFKCHATWLPVSQCSITRFSASSALPTPRPDSVLLCDPRSTSYATLNAGSLYSSSGRARKDRDRLEDFWGGRMGRPCSTLRSNMHRGSKGAEGARSTLPDKWLASPCCVPPHRKGPYREKRQRPSNCHSRTHRDSGPPRLQPPGKIIGDGIERSMGRRIRWEKGGSKKKFFEEMDEAYWNKRIRFRKIRRRKNWSSNKSSVGMVYLMRCVWNLSLPSSLHLFPSSAIIPSIPYIRNCNLYTVNEVVFYGPCSTSKDDDEGRRLGEESTSLASLNTHEIFKGTRLFVRACSNAATKTSVERQKHIFHARTRATRAIIMPRRLNRSRDSGQAVKTNKRNESIPNHPFFFFLFFHPCAMDLPLPRIIVDGNRTRHDNISTVEG